MKEPVAELKTRLQTAMDMNNKKPVDLVNDLGVPKSAMSQYLSGKSKDMDSRRLYKICSYLNVSEGWMMGYDVPMERQEMTKNTPAEIKNSNTIADIADRMLKDSDFLEAVKFLNDLDQKQIGYATQVLNLFFKEGFKKDK